MVFSTRCTDPSGNVRTNTYRVNVSGSTRSFSYDANGSLTAEGTKAYEWDGANRLVRVLDNAAEIARFVYDGRGRRAQKIAGGVTRSYVYDGEDILEERPSAGPTGRHIHGPGIDQLLASVESGSVSYFLADHLGSVLQRTDAAAAVTLTRQYDPWGTMLQGSATAGYAFTGREWDSETGLYYYRARHYTSLEGRFVSEDPIRFSGGINLYRYAENAPTVHTDPLGLFTDPWGTACSVAIGLWARLKGPQNGWPWAHCMASCRIAKACGQPAAWTAGELKEYLDAAVCIGTLGNSSGSCNSAFQPSDDTDNFIGATCPRQISCNQACSHLLNVPDTSPERPPGPLGGL